jgi:putative transposase
MINSRAKKYDRLLNYKFRLYPSEQQEQKLAETLEGCRWVYNYFLSIPPMSEYDMNYALTELKERHPWLRNYYAKMLQMISKQVATARKTARGRLLYKFSDRFNAFTYNQWGFRIQNNRLWLSKIGWIRIVLHCQAINIKQITVCRKNSRWYAIVACEVVRRRHSVIKYTKPVGIDVGITKFAHDSDNHTVDNPLFLTKMLGPLRRASRRVTRRKLGSKNREKSIRLLARLHERIENKRKNFLHNLSTEYDRRYDLIFVERLKVSNMARNPRFARKILDSSWYTFRFMLKYKANRMVEVCPEYTSINCSRCDNAVQKSLTMRNHICPKCGLKLDRDYNAALNILQEGLAFLHLPVQRGEITPVEIPLESLKQETHHLGE